MLGVGAGVFVHLLGGELLTGLVLVGRVTDEAGKRTDQERDIVAKVLELAQLPHGDGVAQMQVRRARVVATIHPQRAAFFFGLRQPLTEFLRHTLFGFGVAVLNARHQHFDLFVQGGHDLRFLLMLGSQ